MMMRFEDFEVLVLKDLLPGFTPRHQQRKVANFISQAVLDGEHALVQAPVGVGKSLTLAPVIKWAAENGKRIVIATATNILAEQYATKDLPLIQQGLEKLGIHFEFRMLKGRSNYVCSWQLQESDSELAPKIRQELRRNPMHSGDFNDFAFEIPRSERQGLSITSTECPGLSHCDIGRKLGCYPARAKDAAKDATVVLTNISALITNAQVDNALFGNVDVVVVDEAHNLDQYTLSALGSVINIQGLGDLVTKLEKAVPDLTQEAKSVKMAAEILGQQARQTLGEETFVKIPHSEVVESVMNDTNPMVPALVGLNAFKQRLGAILKKAKEDFAALSPEEIESGDSVVASSLRNTSRLHKQVSNMMSILKDYLMDEDSVRWVSSYEVKIGRKKEVRYSYNISPIDSAGFLTYHFWKGPEDREVDLPPVILMSGTLAEGKDFAYTKRTLGCWNARELVVDSPFDYERQAALYVPDRDAPEPRDFDAWLQWYVRQAVQIVDASNGGALLLFTSRRAMEAAHEILGPVISTQYRVLIQDGEMSNKELGRVFNDDPNSVLFALRSFFEGFDPKLGSCRAVVLDKLPFPVPTDVIFEARAKRIDAKEGPWSSFNKLSIPMMSLVLTQAFGRLIRSTEHAGVFAIMDSRLSKARYGQRIVKSLPPARRVDLNEGLDFLQKVS